MGQITDDAPMELEVVDPNETGLTVDEAYALLADIDGRTSTAHIPPESQLSAKVSGEQRGR